MPKNAEDWADWLTQLASTQRERDEARDLYAKSQTALREVRHELNTFKHEWHERFGYMATRAKPDSIESIDEVACLINERREQDAAEINRLAEQNETLRRGGAK